MKRRIAARTTALVIGAALACTAGEFPRWRGANSNGSAGEPGMPLAASWDGVKVAWASETLSPHPWNYSVVRGRTQWPRTVLGNGGYCMPAVSGGKVYVAFWRPSGTIEATTGDGKYPLMWVNSGLKAYRLIDADMVIVCLDARTGATTWEAVWPGTEMNHVELYGGHNNLCVEGGRVFAIGGVGLLYAADARTGERLWSASLGPSAKVWERFREHCRAQKLKSSHAGSIGEAPAVAPVPPHPQGGSLHSETYNTCVVAADGVVVSGEWSARNCLVGFDAATGRELWRQPAGSGGLVPPLRWTHAGREYLIVAAGDIRCLDPKTGKILWTAGQLRNIGYDAATPAIEGDYLVAHGAGTVNGKAEGWVGYRLSPVGAEKVWALGNAYLCGSYIAPVIHRGHVWFNFSRDKGVTGLAECDTSGDAAAIGCAELATGKVVAEIGGIPMNSTCPGPVAMGDRLIYQGGEYLWMMDIADPKRPKFLGSVPEPVNLCSSASAADGFVYFRSAERLVACLDVRQGATPHGQIELALTDALGEGQTPRLYLRGREGRFPQTWATCPPRHLCPDPVEAGTLRRDGDRVTGQVKAYLDGFVHDYRLNVKISGGGASGDYEDRSVGVAVTGRVAGTMRAAAGKNARLGMTWPRHWCGGQNQGHEHNMTVTVRDGKVTDVTLVPRLANSGGFRATTESHALAFDGRTITGTVVVQVTTDHIGKSGRYTLEFDGAIENNRVASGKVKSTRDGAAATTHPLWGGEIEVPETEAANPERAVFALDLKDSIRYANDTSGSMDTRLWFTTDGGKVVAAVANARQNAGMHRADGSGVRVEGNRLTGRVETWIKADGYVLRADSHNVYTLDLALDGSSVSGSYAGTYDLRATRRGSVTGTVTD
jgi:outer membrane protein assembly factor BamB